MEEGGSLAGLSGSSKHDDGTRLGGAF